MSSTAVLVFASLEHSARKFPHLASRTGRRVFAALTLRVTNLARQVFGSDVFLSVPANEFREFQAASAHLLPQNGADFSERLSGSIEQVFQLGYEHVLVLGNDSPQLDLEVLQQSQEAFQAASFLLGPDHRGGVYLLGVSRHNFHLLSRIAWNKSSDFAQLLVECEQQHETVAILDIRSDLDSLADLEQILRDSRRRVGNAIRLVLCRLLSQPLPQPISTSGFNGIPSVLRNICIANQLPPPLSSIHPI
jgi:glycosyltransferase A (GT-A) superfamily protein (DUF2064 family)